MALGSPDDVVVLGAVIRRHDLDDMLEPGGGCADVELAFWADEARLYATAGEKFEIWYNGRVVGHGKVATVIEGE